MWRCSDVKLLAIKNGSTYRSTKNEKKIKRKKNCEKPKQTFCVYTQKSNVNIAFSFWFIVESCGVFLFTDKGFRYFFFLSFFHLSVSSATKWNVCTNMRYFLVFATEWDFMFFVVVSFCLLFEEWTHTYAP